MSRSNSVSPPGVGAPGLRGGTEHRSAWGESQSVANGCPYSARSPRRKLTRTNSRWTEEDDLDHRPPGRASTTVSRVSFRSRSAWQDHGEESRDNNRASSKRPDGEVRPKSVELGLEERRAKPRSDEEEVMPEVNFSFVACCTSVMHIFKSKKFQSEKLERLYQRYFFRLNQSSLTMLMGVLVLVYTVMLGFHCSGGRSGPSVTYVVVFSVAIFLTLVLMVICNRNGFHQDHMWVVCYVVILMVLVIQVIGVLLVQPRSASEGIWWTVFFIHVIYTLLPVRMRAAVITGVILSAIHVAISWMLNETDSFLWKQVRRRMRSVFKRLRRDAKPRVARNNAHYTYLFKASRRWTFLSRSSEQKWYRSNRNCRIINVTHTNSGRHSLSDGEKRGDPFQSHLNHFCVSSQGQIVQSVWFFMSDLPRQSKIREGLWLSPLKGCKHFCLQLWSDPDYLKHLRPQVYYVNQSDFVGGLCG